MKRKKTLKVLMQLPKTHPVAKAIRLIREKFPQLIIITDVCLCAVTKKLITFQSVI